MSGSRNSSDVPRRRSHVETPVAYAAVGASRAADLLRYPPEGSTPYEESLKLGSGEERFVTASSLLMTWGAQRGSGFQVDEVDPGLDHGYEGVVFDGAGAAQAAAPREDTFGPDGSPYLRAGTVAQISAPEQEARRVLVIYTIDEARTVGFAWGSGDELGAVGEQLFMVEHRDDDTVWAVARGFLTAPKSGLLGLKARADLRTALDDVKRQVQALSPVVAATVTVSNATDTAEPENVEASIAAAEPAASGDASPAVVVNADATLADALVESPEESPAPSEAAEAAESSTAPRTVHQRRPSRPSPTQGD